jgi:uncharacterized membrane protein YphA (DoxX/SURF4 family)
MFFIQPLSGAPAPVLSIATMQSLAHLRSPLALLLLFVAIPWDVSLLYLAGAIALLIGTFAIIRNKEIPHRLGVDKVLALGPICFAIPLAVFGAEHLTSFRDIAPGVPTWIPGHVFWVVFVGLCLIAAGLSISAARYVQLSASLVAVMIFSFVLLIHIPNIVRDTHNRDIWAVCLRDLAFAAGALSLAVTRATNWSTRTRHTMITVARLVFAVAIAVFGVEHLLHPGLAPGVPLTRSIPPWIPAHAYWGYPVGVIYLVAAVFLLANRATRIAATWLGVTVLALVLLIYIPIEVDAPGDVANALNYLFDTLMFAGAVLLVAEAQPRTPRETV